MLSEGIVLLARLKGDSRARKGVSLLVVCCTVMAAFASLAFTAPSARAYSTPDSGVTWTLDDLVLNSAGAVTGGLGTYYFHEPLTVMPSDTLMINGPNTCSFDPMGGGIYLEIRGGFNVDGMGLGVTFTSADPTPSPGDWGGIRVGGFGGFRQMMYGTIEYATEGLFVNNSMFPMLDNVEVRYCFGTGIHYDFVMGGPTITNCEVHHNWIGIVSINSTAQIGNMGPNYIHNNTADGIYGEGMGVGSYGNRIENNGACGIRGKDWDGFINGCNISMSQYGIYLEGGRVGISNTNITDCPYSGLYVKGPVESWSTIDGLRIENAAFSGMSLENVHELQRVERVFVDVYPSTALEGVNSNATFANSTVVGAGISPGIALDAGSHFVLINTTFDKAHVYFIDSLSDIEARWFMNVLVQNPHFEPLAGAALRVTDNANGTYDANFTTALDGFVRYIQAAEYWQNTSHKVSYTSHNVSAAKPGYVSGWAVPEPLMDQTRTIIITLGYDAADLNVTVSGIAFLPNDRVDKGWLATIQATIRNGGGRADNVEVRFMHGMEMIGTQLVNVKTLNKTLVAQAWTPTEKGTYDVRVQVDPSNVILETDETNNEAVSSLNVHDWTDHYDNETRVMSKTNAVVSGSQATMREIWDLKYEGDVIPESASPAWSITGSTGLRSVSNGILTINDYASGTYCYFYRSWGISRFTNFTIEARVWVQDSDPAPQKIEFYDGRSVELLLFRANGIELDYANLVYSMNTTDGYHVYRITRGGALGRDLKVYVDGVLRIDAPGAYTVASAANLIRFGSFSTTAISISSWDYLRYSLIGAYPGSTAYFGAGSLLSRNIPLKETTWGKIYVEKTDYDPSTYVSISVLDASNNTIPGFLDRMESVIDISSINPAVYSTIRVRASLHSGGDASPILDSIGVDSKTSYSRALPMGWNLVSIPLVLKDESLSAALSSIAGCWDKMMVYTPGQADLWKTNFTVLPDFLDDLKEISHTQGFWLNVTAPGTTLNVEGFLPTSNDILLKAGWNLVGYPVVDDSTYTVGMLKVQTGATIVEGFDGGAEYLTQPLPDGNVLQRGQGYWINVPTDVMWTVEW